MQLHRGSGNNSFHRESDVKAKDTLYPLGFAPGTPAAHPYAEVAIRVVLAFHVIYSEAL